MKLAFREYGQHDRNLIIFHGLFGLSDNWVQIAKIFSEKFRVITPDLRGHGNSEHGKIISYPNMAEDIVNLMHDLGISKANFLGHSMGGKLAMYLSQHYPGKLEKLIVADMRTGVLPYSNDRFIKTLQSIKLENLSSREEAAIIFMQLKMSALQTGLLQKNLKRSKEGKFSWKFDLEGIVKSKEFIKQATEDAVYHGSSLFLKAEYSDYISHKHLADIHKYFPNAKISVIPNASHWLHVDAKEDFCREVMGFLELK